MTDIDEATMIAWVDGELDEVTRRRVDRAVAEDPALAARLDIHRRLRERLADHYDPVAAEPLPAAMRALLKDSETIAPLRPSAPSRRAWGAGAAIAASLLVGVGIGHLSGDPAGPVAIRNGVLVAQGPLASALDTQLASAQEGAATRMGISFRRKGGGWCRSFQGEAASGVACRREQGWTVEQLLPGNGRDSAYRQASAGDSRIMATVEALIEGAPADAGQEAAARANGWR